MAYKGVALAGCCFAAVVGGCVPPVRLADAQSPVLTVAWVYDAYQAQAELPPHRFMLFFEYEQASSDALLCQPLVEEAQLFLDDVQVPLTANATADDGCSGVVFGREFTLDEGTQGPEVSTARLTDGQTNWEMAVHSLRRQRGFALVGVAEQGDTSVAHLRWEPAADAVAMPESSASIDSPIATVFRDSSLIATVTLNNGEFSPPDFFVPFFGPADDGISIRTGGMAAPQVMSCPEGVTCRSWASSLTIAGPTP